MTPFKTTIRAEGSQGNLRITVPHRIADQLRATGFHPPGWVKLHVDGFTPIFVHARFPPSRPSVTCTLPTWAFEGLQPGNEITARVEDAVPYRARSHDGAGFDWLPHVDRRYLAEDVADQLVLHSRHEEPFVLTRFASSPWWLFGLYQAEGSKSKNAPDWTLANANPALLAAVPPALEALGIPPDRQYIEVLHAKGQDPVEAEAAFACVGVRRAATRLRPGAGGQAGVLHVSKSQPLLRLFKSALDAIFADDWQWPSKEAARDYTLGWLDGDGTITINNTASVDLRLAGLKDEHRVLQMALGRTFNWGHNKGSGWQNNKNGTHITLRATEMLDLLDANAFRFSMSRARLLLAFGDRVHGLVHGERWGAYRQWGLTDQDSNLTAKGETICRGHKRYAQKIERARQLKTASPQLFGVKGVVLPDGLANENS